MDILVNPKFDKHIQNKSFPESFLEKLRINLEELIACRHLIKINNLVDSEIKFMNMSSCINTIVLAAQAISDYLLFYPKSDLSTQHSSEYIGETLYYLINEVKSKFKLDKIIVIQNASVFKCIYNSLQCCLFNNRAFFHYGLKMAIDPFTRMIFVKAYDKDEFYSDIGCAIIFQCEDKMKNSYLILDGLVGNLQILQRIGYPWQKIIIDSLIKFAHFKKNKLAININHIKYEEELYEQFYNYVASSYKVEKKSVFLEKKTMNHSFSFLYNNTWTEPCKQLSHTNGTVNIMEIKHSSFRE